MDAFNKASQAVSTVENAKYTAQRAGAIVPKSNKPKPAEAEVRSSGSMAAKDRAAIEKAKRAWVAAFKAEDWDALVDQYAEDAVLLPPEEEAISGHEAIRANYASGDMQTSNEDFQTVEIKGNDMMAFVQGSFSFTIKSKDNTIDVSGKYIEIWEKQDDGIWLITHDIWNANPAG